MSNVLSDYCRVILMKISMKRSHLLSLFKVPECLRPSYVTYALAIICVTTIIVLVFLHEGTISLFSFHPFFMSVGLLLFMFLGILSYRDKILLEIFSPIMQHGPATKSRTMHMTFQYLAASFSCLGLVFILANKLKNSSSVIPHTFHSILGFAVLCCIAIQILIGRGKNDRLFRQQVKKYPWHGKMGLVVSDMVILSVITGICELIGYFSLGSTFIVIMLIAFWTSFHNQMIEGKHIFTSEIEDNRSGQDSLLDIQGIESGNRSED